MPYYINAINISKISVLIFCESSQFNIGFDVDLEGSFSGYVSLSRGSISGVVSNSINEIFSKFCGILSLRRNVLQFVVERVIRFGKTIYDF